jgi:hypothetical protein
VYNRPLKKIKIKIKHQTKASATNHKLSSINTTMPPRAGPIPRRPDGQPAWFTEEHNAFLERLLNFPPGSVLEMYQTYLVRAAQVMLGDYGPPLLVPPPAYERVAGAGVGGGEGVERSEAPPAPPRALRARPGHGPGNLEGLSRRGAVRIPESRRVRQREEEHEEGGNGSGRRVGFGSRAGVPARRPVPAPAGERVQRGRVGDARNDNSGSVSSRTRSRSVRRRGNGGRRGSFEEFAYVSSML